MKFLLPLLLVSCSEAFVPAGGLARLQGLNAQTRFSPIFSSINDADEARPSTGIKRAYMKKVAKAGLVAGLALPQAAIAAAAKVMKMWSGFCFLQIFESFQPRCNDAKLTKNLTIFTNLPQINPPIRPNPLSTPARRSPKL